MTDNETTEGAGSEPIAGTNLTTIPAYSKTALAIAELKQRFSKVIVDVSTKKGLEALTKDVAELRSWRTGLEKLRKEKKAPLLLQEKELDNEAARLTAQIVEMEEPMKLQLDAANAAIENARLQKLEDERLRVEAILSQIQAIRAIPESLIGKPAVIIQGQLAKLQALELTEEGMAEHYQTALDARDAVIGRVTTMLHDQKEADAEKQRQIERDAEMEALRKERAEMQAKLDQAEAERVERVRKQAAEEAATEQAKKEAAAAAQRKIDEDEQRRVQAIRDRISSIVEYGVAITGRHSQWLSDTLVDVDGMRPSDSVDFFAEFLDEANAARNATIEKIQAELAVATAREKAEAEAKAEREEVEAQLEAQRIAQAEKQKQLDEQQAQLRREQASAAKKAEADRLANLGLREAAQAVVDHFEADIASDRAPKVIFDLAAVLDASAQAVTVNRSKPARAKKAAQG